MSASLTVALIGSGVAMFINGSNVTLDKNIDELWDPINGTVITSIDQEIKQSNPDFLLLRNGCSVKLTFTPDRTSLAPQHQGFYVYGGLEVKVLANPQITVTDFDSISVRDKSTEIFRRGRPLIPGEKISNKAILCDKNNPDPITIEIKAARDVIIPLPGDYQIKVSMEVDFVPDID